MTSPVFSPVVQFSVTMSPLCSIDSTHSYTRYNNSSHTPLIDYSTLYTTVDQTTSQYPLDIQSSANTSSISTSTSSSSSYSASALSHHLFPAFAPCKPGRHRQQQQVTQVTS